MIRCELYGTLTVKTRRVRSCVPFGRRAIEQSHGDLTEYVQKGAPDVPPPTGRDALRCPRD